MSLTSGYSPLLALVFACVLSLGSPAPAQIHRDNVEQLVVVTDVRGVDKDAQPILYATGAGGWARLNDRLVDTLRSTPLKLTGNVIHNSDADLERLIAARARKEGIDPEAIRRDFLNEFDVYALMVFGTFEYIIETPYPAFPGTEYRMNYVTGATAVLVDAETGRIVLAASAIDEGITTGDKQRPTPAVQAAKIREMYATSAEHAVRELVAIERINSKHGLHPLAIMGVRTEDQDASRLLAVRGFPQRYGSPCDFLSRCTAPQCSRIESLVANAAAARLSGMGKLVVPPFWSDWAHAGQQQAEIQLSLVFPKEDIKISHKLDVAGFVAKSQRKLVVSVKTLNESQRAKADGKAVDHAYAAWLNVYAFDTEGTCAPKGPPAVFAKMDNQSSGSSNRVQTRITMGQTWTPSTDERAAHYIGAILDAIRDWK